MQTRLKQARKEAHKSQMQIANHINTTQQQIAKYENGINDMTLSRAYAIAEYLNISLDYLTGRTDIKEVNK